MKSFFEKIAGAFRATRRFVAKYIAEILLGALALRQFIIGDWFLGISAIAGAVVIFIVNYFKK